MSFKSRFVRTKEFVDEEEAGKILYRSTFRTQREDKSWLLGSLICLNNAFDLRLKNGANTNSVYWADRLMIFFEAGVPHLLCPKTLDTIGQYDMEVGENFIIYSIYNVCIYDYICSSIGLKQGMTVLIPTLYNFNPDLHDQLFGAAMTAHPKIDKLRNAFVVSRNYFLAL